MTPLEKYQQFIQSGKFQRDPVQRKAITELDVIYQALIPRLKRRNTIFGKLMHSKTPITGLYLWGGVGIGKTWLMDIFYDSLPPQGKCRTHFHRFMKGIHNQLKSLQGRKNPLNFVAKQFAKEYQVLCFDEFLVADITDAMLLAGLLKALFKEGVTLITTSNVNPDLLYKGGVSRDRFLPAIDLIKQFTQVMHLASKEDYRLRTLRQVGVYYTPLNEATRENMRQRFEVLAGSHWKQGELLIIEGRGIPTVRLGRSIVWFNFEVICNIPRSQLDYLEIAKSFHTVLLSNVAQLSAQQSNEALYLIKLVDVFYDAQVKLIMSAACAIDDIYSQGSMLAQFERTKSRLHEMQSLEYLQKPHMV